MEYNEGLKKFVDILSKADNKHYCKGNWRMWGNTGDESEFNPENSLYCSIGIVAKELGYGYTDKELYHLDETPSKFVTDKLKIPDYVLMEIAYMNDEYCKSYQCVATELKERFSL